jgi:hypothetical protein
MKLLIRVCYSVLWQRHMHWQVKLIKCPSMLMMLHSTYCDNRIPSISISTSNLGDLLDGSKQ